MNSVAFMRNLRYTELYFYKGGIERRMEKSRKQFIGIVLIMVFMIALTRGLTISHNMELHPDEHVFYNAAQSLKGYISGSSPVYEEEKEYPEGAIVLQVPFHILTAIINHLAGTDISPQLSGRIAAVFYFTVGSLLGSVVLYRYFTKNIASLALYGAITVFSTIHITQSRYGTADAITFPLLMAVILFTALALEQKSHRYLCITAAFFMSGALCAVKYPLIFFSAIPVYGIIRILKPEHFKYKYLLLFIAIPVLYLGFALLSPKAAIDPLYIIRASTREIGAYMSEHSASNYSWIWTHFMSMFTFSTLYSGFPLVTFFFVAAVCKMRKVSSRTQSTDILFSTVLPIVIMIFFTYNIFVRLLVSRSFYPFFFLTDLYAAYFVGSWLCDRNHIKRAAAIFLCTVMVARGCYYIVLLSEKHASDRYDKMILSSVDKSWNKTTILSGFLVLPSGYNEYPSLSVVNSDDKRFSDKESILLENGELFIAGAREFTVYSCYFNFLPSLHSDTLDSITWENFKTANSEYYVGSLYPRYVNYILGNWLMGTNGCYEFPTTTLFYRP